MDTDGTLLPPNHGEYHGLKVRFRQELLSDDWDDGVFSHWTNATTCAIIYNGKLVPVHYVQVRFIDPIPVGGGRK